MVLLENEFMEFSNSGYFIEYIYKVSLLIRLKLENNNVDFKGMFVNIFKILLLKVSHFSIKVWIEQPENYSTCLALRPYPREDVKKMFKGYNLLTAQIEPVPETNKKNVEEEISVNDKSEQLSS